jgi:hypothetical protein
MLWKQAITQLMTARAIQRTVDHDDNIYLESRAAGCHLREQILMKRLIPSTTRIGSADRSRDRPIDRAGFENQATVRVEECEC